VPNQADSLFSRFVALDSKIPKTAVVPTVCDLVRNASSPPSQLRLKPSSLLKQFTAVVHATQPTVHSSMVHTDNLWQIRTKGIHRLIHSRVIRSRALPVPILGLLVNRTLSSHTRSSNTHSRHILSNRTSRIPRRSPVAGELEMNLSHRLCHLPTLVRRCI